MNEKQKQKQPQQQQTDGVDPKDGAGVRFVPSEEPSKLEPTPETAREERNAHH